MLYSSNQVFTSTTASKWPRIANGLRSELQGGHKSLVLFLNPVGVGARVMDEGEFLSNQVAIKYGE